MKKVQLTKEQVKGMQSIESLLSDDWSPAMYESPLTVLEYKQSGVGFTHERECLNSLTDVDFLNAFVYGYEEKPLTKGEQIHEKYREACRLEIKPFGSDFDQESYNYGYRRAINDLIDDLGVDLFNIK